MNWLAKKPNGIHIDFSDSLQGLLIQVTQSTAVWILDQKKFLEWKDASNTSQTLWMHGIRKYNRSPPLVFHQLTLFYLAGSGKTMLVLEARSPKPRSFKS